jgi:uncharacterized protein YndB with AHSA1/START domain
VASWRQQALIEAPVEAVWMLVGDPARYPEWAEEVVEVTGLAEVDEGSTFRQVTKTPLGKTETTFEIEELDELHEIKLRCTSSGYYSRWLLTEAQDATFVDVEIGADPTALRYRAAHFAFGGKRYFRNLADGAIDGVRRIAERASRRG